MGIYIFSNIILVLCYTPFIVTILTFFVIIEEILEGDR